MISENLIAPGAASAAPRAGETTTAECATKTLVGGAYVIGLAAAVPFPASLLLMLASGAIAASVSAAVPEPFAPGSRKPAVTPKPGTPPAELSAKALRPALHELPPASAPNLASAPAIIAEATPSEPVPPPTEPAPAIAAAAPPEPVPPTAEAAPVIAEAPPPFAEPQPEPSAETKRAAEPGKTAGKKSRGSKKTDKGGRGSNRGGPKETSIAEWDEE